MDGLVYEYQLTQRYPGSDKTDKLVASGDIMDIFNWLKRTYHVEVKL